jgi:phospholipid/cholesterol/gamma-HCH transport system substrate-binding protein
MDLHYKREVTVGGLVILAAVLFVGGTILLGGGHLTTARDVQVDFREVSGLKPGSPVRVSGVGVGRGERIDLEGVGKVRVTFSVPPKIAPHIDAQVSVLAVGLVGDVALDYNPGAASQLLPEGQVIVGTEAAPGLSAKLEDMGAQAKQVMTGASEILNQRTADDLHNTLLAMQRLMNAYSDRDQGPTAELTATMASLRRMSDRLDHLLGDPHTAATLAHLDTLSGNLATSTRTLGDLTGQLTRTSASLDTLLAGMNAGKGTLGKLATDSGLYNDARRTSAALTALLEELKKNPGKLNIQVRIF